MALTDLAIKHAKPKDRPYTMTDDGGLGIEVSPAGGKVWRWRFRYDGKHQTLTIGKYPSISIAKARLARDEARDQVHAGYHPNRVKQAQKLRRMAEKETTFESVARKWHEIRGNGLNKKYHSQILSRMEQYVFPLIGALPIKEITIPDVVKVVEKIGDQGIIVTAKRMKQYISQVFRYATHRGLCDQNPAADLRDILPSADKDHHPCVPMDEVPQLLQAVEARKEDLSKFALKLIALTFVRTGELIGAKWEEINWEREEWHIPAERMKMKRPHVVPLARQTLEILKELHKVTGQREFLFFSAASKSNHISNGTILMALRRMGYKNRHSGHGFRTLLVL
jgi:integrase